MSQDNQYHLSTNAAEDYERQKVPALFGPMAEATLDVTALPKCGDVIDVACGTGVVARAVGMRLSEPSHIAGADINPAMIEIARRQTPQSLHKFEWVAALAENLPFEDAVFDLAFCQQGLQFFPEKQAVLKEIRRVMRKGGNLILTCWASVPPFFAVVADVLRRHINEAASKKAVAPFAFNDGKLIQSLVSNAGFECPAPDPLPVMRTMPATSRAMRDEILASPNEPVLRAAGNAVIDNVVADILEGVSQFRSGDTLAMPQQTHLFRATAV